MEYIVSTPCGTVRGCAGTVPGTVAFKGIRYATAGRWEYPRQVTSWEGVYDATEYGACCYQARAFYEEELNKSRYFYYKEFRRGGTFTYSEDCLFLNIFIPENAKEGDKLPVLFYIHGGGFTGGCSHERHFDGPVWPTQGVIGVTCNYRLGPFGFACLPELKEEAGYTGNYGLFDQMVALQWVRDNIASFGGDPACVTIMGQSAGAMSVQQHSLSPLTKGLFKGAVMCSGGGVNRLLSAKPAENYYGFWEKTMELAGCENLEQLRAVSPRKVFDAWKQAQSELKMPGSFPCIDGRFVVGSGTDLLRAGDQHKIAYMAGATSEDMMPPILQSMSRKWCEKQEVPSYTWHFDRRLPGDENGAWHSADLWYWFGTLDNCWRPWEEKDRALSRQMVAYLCNFVRTGNPNKGGQLPTWIASDKTQKRVLVLGERETGMRRTNTLKLVKTMLTKKSVG